MRSLHSFAVVALVAASGCMSSAQTPPNYNDEYAGVSSGPDDPSFNESSWTGPPGGAMDEGYGYADPNFAQSPSGQGADAPTDLSPLSQTGAYGGDAYGGQAYGNAWVDPSAQGEWTGATADVTDGEIDQTLTGYGEWVIDPDYGNVWRPDATIVGADFTPYESCGSWIYTDYGWTFQSCDEWGWGWLAFHYGRWVFLDNSWCWSRDYSWGPGWVDWRYGGDYVGWRPMRPTRQIRDHRDRHNGPLIRDHRRNPTEKWSFNHVNDFGHGRNRPTTLGVRDGLRATTSVAQPPIRGDFRGRASTVMAGRLRDHQRFNTRTARDGQMGQSTRGYNTRAPSWDNTRGYNTRQPSWNNTRGYNAGGPRTAPNRGYNPTYDPTAVTPDRNRPTWQSTRPYTGPTRGYNAPSNTPYTGPTRDYNAPSRPSYTGPTRNYNAPSRPSYTGPTRNYNAPSRPSYTGPTRNYNAPSRPSYTGPTRNYNAPSRPSYTGPTRNYNAPSRPSSSGSTRSAPSSSPSRSYSAPSRSSSSSSSGSSRSSSSSSSSRSSGSSSSSSGGSRGGGGGRHR